MLTGPRCRSPHPIPWNGCTAISRAEAGDAPPRDCRMFRPLLSAIIMKLLAKTAEERYQTAGGLERDLRRCVAEWETQRAHWRLRARRTRHARPASDPRATLWTRGASPKRCWPPSTRVPEKAAPLELVSGLWLFRHRQVLGRQMSSTRCWCRRADCSASGKFRPAQAATSRIRLSRRAFSEPGPGRCSVKNEIGPCASGATALARGAGERTQV